MTNQYASAAGSGDNTELTLDKLLDSMRSIKLTPVPVSIWVVDRPDWFSRIKEIAALATPPNLTVSPLGGLPVREFSSFLLNPLTERIASANDNLNDVRRQYPDLIIWPWWCAVPGVYVEMSDGKLCILAGA